MSLQYAILGLLTYTAMTGYNLKTLFDKSINHFWKASLSQIYRELSVLEEKGYVISEILPQEDRPDKRVYNITQEGEKAFHKWLADFPETLISPKRDEFLVRIFFGKKLGKQEVKRQLNRYIDERKVFLESLNEMIKKLGRLVSQDVEEKDDPNVENEAFYWNLTVKRAQIISEASIRWAEESIKELEEIKE